MLAVTQLAGFAVGQANVGRFDVVTDSASNTNTPTFSIDLGPAGLKQVFILVGCHDDLGSAPWTFSTGTLDGDALTQIIGSGQEVAGNGGGHTAGTTIRAIETSKGGVVSLAIGASGFSGVINTWEAMAIITTGMSVTALSTDSGDSQGSSNGADFDLDTTGATLVVGGGVGNASGSIPGAMTGPGNEVTPVSGARISLGYDRATPGGAQTYDFTGATYVIAGAAFGPA